MPGGTDLLRNGDRRRPAAAADIDNPLAGRDARAINQSLGDRREQRVLRRLALDPALSRGPFQ